MTTTNTHDWRLSTKPPTPELAQWIRRCLICRDRVTAYRATAIYQLGNDPEQIAHVIAPDHWPEYAECRPADRAVSEAPARYDSRTVTSRRPLKPVTPSNQVEQLLTRLMETNGWSKQRMADELDTDVRQLHRWLHGVQPSGYATLRLARLALLTRERSVIRPIMRRHTID